MYRRTYQIGYTVYEVIRVIYIVYAIFNSSPDLESMGIFVKKKQNKTHKHVAVNIDQNCKQVFTSK